MGHTLDNLEKLLYLSGVSAEYYNYSGQRIFVPYEVRLRLLEAMGYDISNQQAIDQAIYELDARPWQCWLQPVNVMTLGESEYIDIRIHQDQKFNRLDWHIVSERGEQFSGSLVPAELAEVGEYYIEGVRYSAHRLSLAGLPTGYHQIMLCDGGREQQAQLMVAPGRCYNLSPGSRGDEDRLWGISCQLYTLRSKRNWGIGDFSDLMELIEFSSSARLDFIALNPLHALLGAGTDYASPYSPSDRRFLNPLYIDPERVEDCIDSAAIGKQLAGQACQKKMAELRASELVDYEGVAWLKYSVFDQMYQHFQQHHLQPGTARAGAFEQFVLHKGESLQQFSEFESRQKGLGFQHAEDPVFHQYLQWIGDQQLCRCQALARAGGMRVGLMGDLAVGAVRHGAEIQCNPGLFCHSATIGAPPDPFADNGQDWNLPSLDPVGLRRDHYRHFIKLLQTNMAHCGAIRIDHVMSLLRLWWCLPGGEGGAYVYYPLEHLLAILRLESHRNRCLVVGEDMGVVPEELRERMVQTAVLSNRLFYFECDYQCRFKLPQHHHRDSLLMVTNHDVPTLAGWWHGTDVTVRGEIGLIDSEHEVPARLQQRQQEKANLLQWLDSLQLLPDNWVNIAADSDVDRLRELPFDEALCQAILCACARTNSRLMSFQIDDLQLIQQAINIPGTYREYPNWQRKQRLETRQLFDRLETDTLLSSIYQERKQ